MARMIRITLLFMILLICAGAVRGLIRGTIWLNTTDELQGFEYFSWQSRAKEASQRGATKYTLKEIGLALHNYHDTYGQFPFGGTYDESGESRHSWISSLQGFMLFQFDGIHWEDSWDSDSNAKFFRSRLQHFGVENPRLPLSTINEDGFALSHFAANQHVLGPNRGLKLEEITDGTSQTLLVGEVNSLLQPWGAPTNYRDPMLGLNKDPRGFGGDTDPGGVYFVFADGRVEYLSDGIDQRVLDALATPAGGDDTGPDWTE